MEQTPENKKRQHYTQAVTVDALKHHAAKRNRIEQQHNIKEEHALAGEDFPQRGAENHAGNGIPKRNAKNIWYVQPVADRQKETEPRLLHKCVGAEIPQPFKP